MLSLPLRNLLVFRRWNPSNENLISCVVRVASGLAASRVNPPALITPSFWPEVKQILLITLFVCTGLLGMCARAYARLQQLLLLRCLRQSSRELLLFLLLLDGRSTNDAATDSTRVETISVPISHALLINSGFFVGVSLQIPPLQNPIYPHQCKAARLKPDVSKRADSRPLRRLHNRGFALRHTALSHPTPAPSPLRTTAGIVAKSR